MPVIGFYVLCVITGRVTKNWLLPLARPRAQEPGDYTSYSRSSGKSHCSQIETKRISVKELKPLMSALEEKKMITRAELIKMLSDVDTDGSGTIEFGEFVEMITSKVGNRPYGDVVARLSSRTVVMGNQTVGQSTKHYKAKLKKASVTEQALSCAVTLPPECAPSSASELWLAFAGYFDASEVS